MHKPYLSHLLGRKCGKHFVVDFAVKTLPLKIRAPQPREGVALKIPFLLRETPTVRLFMSFVHRFAAPIVAIVIGVVSGVYIFDTPLKQAVEAERAARAQSPVATAPVAATSAAAAPVPPPTSQDPKPELK